MANINNSQIPLHFPVLGVDGMLSQSWAFWFQNFQNNQPPSGTGFVVDGSVLSYSPMVIYQGLDINKGSSPDVGTIYFAVDTHKTYVAIGGVWEEQTPQFTGDVTKPLGSDVLTLNNVNSAIGTFGSSINVPVVTVNAKGLITNIYTEPISIPTATPGGTLGTIQFNGGSGTFAGMSNLAYDGINTLSLVNEYVTGAIDFVTPATTLNNLLPTQVGHEGEILTTDGVDASWITLPPSDSTTPYLIPADEIFTNNIDRQNLFGEPIIVDGYLVVNGDLIDVAPTGPTPPASPINSIQFNSGGSFAGTSKLTYTETVVGPVSSSLITLNNNTIISEYSTSTGRINFKFSGGTLNDGGISNITDYPGNMVINASDLENNITPKSGGGLFFRGGDSLPGAIGTGGNCEFRGGYTYSGVGYQAGTLRLSGGSNYGTNGNGGNVTILGGSGALTGAGIGGNIILYCGAGTTYGYIRFESNTANLITFSSSGWALGVARDVGTDGQVLTSKGVGFTPEWRTISASGDSTTPYLIPTGETFTNNVDRQNLFAEPITVDGYLVVDGHLLEVTPTEPAVINNKPYFEEFVSTSGQTVFDTTIPTVSVSSNRASLTVYVNGVFQLEGIARSYTVTGANQITFNSGITLGSDVVIYYYQ
jgi:hypothetical protein